MIDRYTKAVLTVISLCLVVLTVSTLLPTAQAQSAAQPQPAVQAQATAQVPASPRKRCVWTSVQILTSKWDNKDATVDRNGDLVGKKFQSLSEGGWELKAYGSTASTMGGSGGTVAVQFVFERCEDK